MTRTGLDAWQREPIRTLAVEALGPLATDALELLAGGDATVAAIVEELGSRVQAIYATLAALDRRGLVERAGKAPAPPSTKPATIWRATPAGRTLAEAIRSG